MLQVFAGENSFEVQQALKALTTDDVEVTKLDGAEIRSGDLAELFGATSLFGGKRLVIVDQLSASKQAWIDLAGYLDRTNDDTTVILLEPKLDKRLVTSKELQKRQLVRELPLWTDRDRPTAKKWLSSHAKKQGVALTSSQVDLLLDRLGGDQWRLHNGLEKLRLLDEITDEAITQVIEARPSENVFALLDTALTGSPQQLSATMERLSRTEDAYRVMGLLSSQVLNLAALKLGGGSATEVAADTKQSPYALRQLTKLTHALSEADVRRLVVACADTDHAMKSTGVDPWLLVTQFLLRAKPTH